MAKKEKKHNTSPQSSSASPEELTDLERNVDLYAYTLFTSESLAIEGAIESAKSELEQEVSKVEQKISGVEQKIEEMLAEREKRMFQLLIGVVATVLGALITLLVTMLHSLHIIP